MSIIIPNTLKKGDTIGVVAPAAPMTVIEAENIRIGVRNLEDMGFSVRFSKNIETSLNNPLSVQKRIEDLHGMFADTGIQCVMALIGGYSSIELLEHLDFELIQENPKNFIGFSDITILNIALREKSNLLNFYGPSFAIFCQKNLPVYTKNHFLNMLTQKETDEIESAELYADDLWYGNNDGNRNWKENLRVQAVRKGSFSGECIGGNLDTFLALAGTPFFPNCRGKVLFLEEGNNPKEEEVRRKFIQLKLMDVFNEIKGLVFGRFCGWSQEKQERFLIYVRENILQYYTFPIIANVDFGHSDPICTIPVGGKMEFDGEILKVKCESIT